MPKLAWIRRSRIAVTLSGQTGSLDEGYADFMGQVFELSYTGQTDWMNGTGITATNAIPALQIRLPFYREGDNLPYPARFYDPKADAFGAHRNLTVPGMMRAVRPTRFAGCGGSLPDLLTRLRSAANPQGAMTTFADARRAPCRRPSQ